MALLGNYSVILKNPATFIGGTQVSNCRNAFNGTGQLRQRYYPETTEGLPTTTALPEGYLAPHAWMLPYDIGAMTTSNLNGSATLSSVGVAGLSGTVTMSGEGLLSATGGLLAGLEVTMEGTGDLTAIGGGLLEAIVTMAGDGTLTAAIGATAGLTVTMAGVGTLVANPSGTGEMVLEIYVNESQATVDQIVAAVWSALAAEYNVSGTMGNKLNGAGSAGDPWTTDLSSYNTAGTAGKIVKDNPALMEIINQGVQKASLLVPHTTDL
jgi:hypothetical protein